MPFETLLSPITIGNLTLPNRLVMPSHLASVFKAETGYGVVAYQNRLRLSQACELLVATDAPIADIAHEVGYEDEFYFSRQFRRVNGSSPREYRRRVR